LISAKVLTRFQGLWVNLFSLKGKLVNSGFHLLNVASTDGNFDATTLPAPKSVPVPASVSVSVGVKGVDLKLPESLPSIEDEFKVLGVALVASDQHGLSPAEATRLNKII
jgi:hypothetical protein